MDLTAKLYFYDADKALQLVAELARSETARNSLRNLKFDKFLNCLSFRIDSIDFFKEWQTSKQDFCKAYDCYADFRIYCDSTSIEERQIISPAGEVLLEEVDYLETAEDEEGFTLVCPNPEFCKKQLEAFVLPF